MRKPFILTAALLLAGCDWLWPERYAAEVGYYARGQVAWELWGDFATLEECRNAAIAVYDAHAIANRAHTWSCLLKNGDGGYTSRHR